MTGQSKYLKPQNKLSQAYARHRVITDKNCNPIDFIFTEVNKPFEIMCGLTKDKVLNKRANSILSNFNKNMLNWTDLYHKVKLNYKNTCFEHYSDLHDRWYMVDINSISIDQFTIIISDITAQKQAEKMHKEFELQQQLTDLANDFINLPLENFDKTINEVFENIGNLFNIDRIYIFKHDHDCRTTSNSNEWCAEGVISKIDSRQRIPITRFSGILEHMKKGNVVSTFNNEYMPDKHTIQALNAEQEPQSLILIPLLKEDENIGFIGFDVIKKQKIFMNQEIKKLKLLADILTSASIRQKNETLLYHISLRDQLTGLYNRHFLEAEMARLNTKRQMPLAVIAADLNCLKLVNDTYGHEKGDEMLKVAASIISKYCRKEDIISRWGGDEFLVLLPRTTVDEAESICKRIKEGCQNTFVRDVPVSIALGVASKHCVSENLNGTIQKAEEALYKQKLVQSRITKSNIIKALLDTLAQKCFETEDHIRAMQTTARKIGIKMNLTEREQQRLNVLISLHDIGKLNISKETLNKKGPLTEEEWWEIKKHPETGYRIAMAVDGFAQVADEILYHHEHWDGSGYPQGLKENEIPLLARITAVADTYEALRSSRPYRQPVNKSKIAAELKKCSGIQLDPEVVDILLSRLKLDE